MSPAKAPPDYFAPTAKRLAAEERSHTRRELLELADRRGELATRMALAAEVTEHVLELPAWDDDVWDGNSRRRVETARRRADLAWEQALDLALAAITDASAPALTDTNTTPENTDEPITARDGATV